uniref:Uncharacterized protein n=1 Tax=Aegilops tauschii subsp. strangulata TaxID=200361 RepID=A0A453LPI9_AEGTS
PLHSFAVPLTCPLINPSRSPCPCVSFSNKYHHHFLSRSNQGSFLEASCFCAPESAISPSVRLRAGP